MKIVHILHNLRGGGMQNLLLSLAPMQVRLGNEVIIVLTDKDTLDYSSLMKKKLEGKGVSVISLNRKVGSTISSVLSLFKCIKLLHRIRPDIINSHGAFNHNYAAISAFFLKSIHIPTIHSAPEKWNKIGYFLNKNKPMIFCSQAAFEFNDYSNVKSIVISNGIDKKVVKSNNKSNLRAIYELSSNTKIIVGVGELRKPKNYPFWIELANSTKDLDIHFFICGGGEGPDFIDPSIFNEPNNLTWLGIRSDIPDILQEADCFLSCSIHEGLPIAVLEAFFSGIPCVLSPIPQHIDIAINISECYIPEKFETEHFKEKITTALSSNKTHELILKERKPFIRKFSIENVAEKYIAFYKLQLNKISQR